jgi:hypothetical protein
LEGPSGATADKPAEPAKPASADPLGGLGFDLTLEPAAGPPSADDTGTAGAWAESEAAATPEAQGEPEKKDARFDFTGFGGMLTEAEPDDDQHDAAPAAPAAAADSGLAIEGVLAASYGDFASDQAASVPGGGLDLEQPLSELPVDPGGWSPRDRMKLESVDDEPAPGESGSARARAMDEQSRRGRARSTPSGPKRRSSPVPALIGAVAVLAVIGGGWFGWTKLANRAPAATVEAAPLDPPVVIPAISPELEPRMRQVADSTMAGWLLAIRTTLPAERGIAVEPDREWLSGSYLADASRYMSIEQYWRDLAGYVDDLEGRDVDMFVGLYRARLDSLRTEFDSVGITPQGAESMLERARAGFLAARPERRPIYQQLRHVVASALGLHEFLLANEDNIEYDPAAGGTSRDPVLEAVPATPELGKEMWARVDSITQSLDALGALDLVTTERLLGLLATKLAEIPLR